ncbi:thiol:disulfide interchange protein DsbD precursor [bacterium BMS3Abin03]|nr:thiol:disulfide interchange protein DsbD precursor [bacterium BMS3Abin03]HDZ59103.1 thiol:disulfide interchange protein [Ignavibacteriales bacterium]
MILAGIYILFFERKAKNIKIFQIIKTVFSLLIIAIAIYALIPSGKEEIDWKPYSEAAIASIDGRGVIIDFYADWCIPCKELDATTFSDPEVVKVSKEFETYKADMTKSLSPEVAALREKYNIVGVPTILILNSKGEEIQRITGFLEAEDFYKIISKLD